MSDNTYDIGRLNLPFVGIATFAKRPYAPDWSTLKADVAVLGAPFDAGAKTGVPDLLRSAAKCNAQTGEDRSHDRQSPSQCMKLTLRMRSPPISAPPIRAGASACGETPVCR